MDPVSRAQAQSGNTQESRIARFGDKRQPPWQPGQSGNRSGRPKRQHITRVMAKIARSKEGRELLESAITDIIAKRGMAAVLLIREMAERIEGKVTQPVELSGEIGVSEVLRGIRERKQSLLPGNVNSNAA